MPKGHGMLHIHNACIPHRNCIDTSACNQAFSWLWTYHTSYDVFPSVNWGSLFRKIFFCPTSFKSVSDLFQVILCFSLSQGMTCTLSPLQTIPNDSSPYRNGYRYGSFSGAMCVELLLYSHPSTSIFRTAQFSSR